MAVAPSADLPRMLAAALVGAELSAEEPALTRLAGFLEALWGADDRLNLTRITEPDKAMARHILEPLAGWALLAPQAPAGAIVEVGSGGGAPGIPIAIVAPARPVTLVESRRRKAAFLEETVAALGLTNVRVVHARGETFAHSPSRESFAVALARALAPPPVALELLLPLLAPAGLATLFVGPAARAVLPDAAAVAAMLGGEPPAFTPLSWPGSGRDLLLLTSRKRRPSPDRYPRNVRQIRRAPLQSAKTRPQ